jgi:sec-independent protein translocase protein TatC
MRWHDDREMELWEHLSELRTRIFRTLIYLAAASIICWLLYDPVLYPTIKAPLQPLIQKYQIQMMFKHITGPFMLKLQVAVIAGLILALPLLTLELWGFVAPGLTPSERKGFYFVVPLSLFFFFLGVVTAYWILPSAFGYFASFLPKPEPGKLNTTLMQDPVLYWSFVMKMILAFGIVFQLPVVLMFLSWIGLVTSQMLKKNWRHSIVLCSVVAAVATPSNDAPTMLMMGVPLVILYFASIWLVSMVERLRAKKAVAAGPSYEAS